MPVLFHEFCWYFTLDFAMQSWGSEAIIYGFRSVPWILLVLILGFFRAFPWILPCNQSHGESESIMHVIQKLLPEVGLLGVPLSYLYRFALHHNLCLSGSLVGVKRIQ
jgi:hypothetical protein